MKKMTIEEVKKVQMDILTYVDKFCRENDIKYSISGGTLLGAVRHGGYIPWDDDIDIMLRREDYQKFKSLFPVLANKQYKLFSNEDHDKFCQPYLNVIDIRTRIESPGLPKDMGVNIDIFPFDHIVDDKEAIKNVFKNAEIYKNLYVIKGLSWRKGRSLYKNAFMLLAQIGLCFISRKRLSKKITEIALNAGPKNSLLRACIVWGYGEKEVMSSSLFEEYVDIIFENRKYMAIKDYTVYLKHLFGNYMQLPLIEKQVTHHLFTAYWKD